MTPIKYCSVFLHAAPCTPYFVKIVSLLPVGLNSEHSTHLVTSGIIIPFKCILSGVSMAKQIVQSLIKQICYSIQPCMEGRGGGQREVVVGSSLFTVTAGW